MTLRNTLYRTLFALRHPDAVAIWRRGVDYDHYRRLNRPWLHRLELRTVIDIGANVGQFARLVHAILPEATIYSFEPLAECHRQLTRALAGYAGFHAFNLAIGDAAGELDFLESAHSPSSSFLPMTSVHEAAYPESRSGSRVRVRLRTLDDVARDLELRENVLVKIDVQGYEGPVLRGGAQTLRQAAVVLIETSFVPLYSNQLLFTDLLEQLQALGFAFHGNLSQYDDPKSGSPLFADSIFINTKWADRVVG